MRLGEIITKLEALPPDLPVRFRLIGDVSGVPDGEYPGDFMSYRGFYDRLGLDWGDWEQGTVGGLLEKARAADGATFEGYKGGEYMMSRDTAVYVAAYGYSDGNQLVAIERRGHEVALVVARVNEW